VRPEMIDFPEDLPAKAFVWNVSEYPYHWHHTLEIIFVLEGEITLGTGGKTHLLSEHNVAVINEDEPHRISNKGKKNKVLFLHMDTEFLERINPDYQDAYFYCCSPYHEETAPEKYQILREYILRLAGLIQERTYQNHQRDLTNCMEEVLVHLIASFDYLRFGLGNKAFKEKQVQRFKKIFRHIRQSPVENYGLRELAQAADITLEYLSHDIKDKFGLSFQELLYCSKCHQAARLLLSTDKMIYTISAECGFSDPKYLIKHFKTNYHCTPSEFRKMYRTGEETLASQVRYEEISPEGIF